MLEDIEATNKFIASFGVDRSKAKEHGEVFTPKISVDNLFDRLDETYTEKYGHSIFTNDKLKWYEPAGGCGAIIFNLYTRLIKHIPKNHILSNMLFVSELCPENCVILNKIFGNGLNLYKGDALSIDTVNIWNIEKFDVIIGNPPFSSRKSGKLDILWPKFVFKHFTQLKPDGYLVQITPLALFSIRAKLHIPILENTIYYLNIVGLKSSKKLYGVSIQISEWIMQYRPNADKNNTIIESDIYGKQLCTMYLNPDQCIPTAYHTILDKVYKLTQSLPLITTRFDLFDDKITDDIVERHEMLPDKKYAIKTYKKNRLYYSEIANIDMEICPKVVRPHCSDFDGVFNDADGTARMICAGNGQKLRHFYTSGDNTLLTSLLTLKIYKIIAKSLHYNSSYFNADTPKYIPDLSSIIHTGNSITADEFYTLLNLTDEEINSINKF